nr:hypothetical protein [uncultured Brevundimonas sp.]
MTGQVRDGEVFDRLMSALSSVGDGGDRIILSTWSDEIARIKANAHGRYDLDRIVLVDAGSPIFAPTISNRDISSFIAQHRQISAGLGVAHVDWPTLRLRADYDCISVEALAILANLLRSIWDRPEYSARCIVTGADDVSPFFFEDRALMMAPGQSERLKKLSLNSTYGSDYFNIFPEFQFYKAIINAEGVFSSHDHRYRVRAGFGETFSEYDYLTFGQSYEDEVQRYLSKVITEVAFLEDAASVVGRRHEYDNLEALGLIPRNFRISNMREYQRTWLSHSDVYRNLAPKSLIADSNIAAAKQLYNALYLNYFSGNLKAVTEMAEIGRPFSDVANEFVGVARLLTGEVDAGLDQLKTLADRGHKGFELYFYLLRETAARGQFDEFDRYADLARAAFPDIERMHVHIDECRVTAESSHHGNSRNGSAKSILRRVRS